MAPGALLPPMVERRGHECLVFGDDAFSPAAARYLAEGAARGDRLLLVGDAPTHDDLLAMVDGPIDAAGLAASGGLLVTRATDLYTPDGALSAERQVAEYAELTALAQADGYAGITVAADVTRLVEQDEARAKFLRYEAAVGHLMAKAPMSAMCAYDCGVLGDAVAELACIHPARTVLGGRDPGFCAYHDVGVLRLEGEVDVGNHDLLASALEAALATAEGPEVLLDLSGLRFIDVEGLARIGRLASEDRPIAICGARAVLRRMWEVTGGGDGHLRWVDGT